MGNGHSSAHILCNCKLHECLGLNIDCVLIASLQVDTERIYMYSENRYSGTLVTKSKSLFDQLYMTAASRHFSAISLFGENWDSAGRCLPQSMMRLKKPNGTILHTFIRAQKLYVMQTSSLVAESMISMIAILSWLINISGQGVLDWDVQILRERVRNGRPEIFVQFFMRPPTDVTYARWKAIYLQSPPMILLTIMVDQFQTRQFTKTLLFKLWKPEYC